MLTNKQKAVLHVAKNRLGLDDDDYRSALEAHGGARSAKNLSYRGFERVMEHFERCGFKAASRRVPKTQRSNRPGMATDAQLRKIKAFWLTLAGSYYETGQEWKALRGFLKKRFHIDHENFLTFEAAHNVIEAIKAISCRRGNDNKKPATTSTST